jgi:peptide deformylase
MSVLPIIQGSSTPVLRRKTALVPKVTKEIRRLLKDMRETMASVQGVGLAAPQVGESLRLCIAMIDGKPEALLNPQILSKSKKILLDEEGCLSLPNAWMPVPRAGEIVVSYMDTKGKQHERKLSEFNARVVQHEVDHLDGVLIVDYVPNIAVKAGHGIAI